MDDIGDARTTGLGETCVNPESVRWYRIAVAMMIVSSILISFSGVIVRNIETVDIWKIALYRSFAFLVAVSVLIAFRSRGRFFGNLKRIGVQGWIGGLIMSMGGMAYLIALTSTTVANTLFMLSGIPFITALLARIILKEKLQTTTLVTMIFAGAGIFVMLVEGFGIGSMFGNLMALCTAVSFSIYAVIVRRNRQIDMLPILIVTSGILVVSAFVARYDDLTISTNDLLLCILWGAGLSGIGNWMFIIASRYLVAAELTLFMLLEFGTGPIWVWLFVGEVPTYWTIVGGTVVISAVALKALFELFESRSRRAPSGISRPPP